MLDLKFNLEDDLSVTDLRKVETWQSRLKSSGKLRLKSHGEVLGVLISRSEWAAMKEEIERFEKLRECLEDERDRRIIEEREGAALVSGAAGTKALLKEIGEAGLL